MQFASESLRFSGTWVGWEAGTELIAEFVSSVLAVAFPTMYGEGMGNVGKVVDSELSALSVS